MCLKLLQTRLKKRKTRKRRRESNSVKTQRRSCSFWAFLNTDWEDKVLLGGWGENLQEPLGGRTGEGSALGLSEKDWNMETRKLMGKAPGWLGDASAAGWLGKNLQARGAR
ncbi:Hypothetical protein NTJ_15384 [Nesidiocoris tenuis]|uniref:Uncharacterized protein n=1 Tax=Nesidiocoris tenuis TaxID=355587 RepID=A0ABN7BDW4_9HEMI|nr:Hypothetical protein NTJ_15384 [Nesidiocoris tenuis]